MERHAPLPQPLRAVRLAARSVVLRRLDLPVRASTLRHPRLAQYLALPLGILQSVLLGRTIQGLTLDLVGFVGRRLCLQRLYPSVVRVRAVANRVEPTQTHTRGGRAKGKYVEARPTFCMPCSCIYSRLAMKPTHEHCMGIMGGDTVVSFITYFVETVRGVCRKFGLMKST